MAESLAWPAPGSADAALLIDGEATLRHADAARLAPEFGITRGERILVRAAPTRACLLSILGIWADGGCAVLTDPREPAERIEALARETSAREVGAEAPRRAPIVRIPCEGLAAILSTSGSTAAPKLVAHSLASLVANARAANARIPYGIGDRWLLSLSPHHVGGLSILVRALVGGGAVRLGRGPGSVAEDLLADRAITHVSIVATQLRRLLERDECAERLREMRAVLLGGGPAPAAWRAAAIARGWPLFVTYGLSECASQVTTGRAAPDGDETDAGTPLDGVDVRIADGEIEVRGPTLLTGYVEGGATRDPRRSDGFLATGDLGRFDARGRLHVTGRKDLMFISGGENIQPEEIERALLEVSGIVAACVVAVEDRTWQRRPIAFVAGAFARDALEAALAARLPRFKWPDAIYRMPEEMAARAKPHRAELRAGGEPLWRRARAE